MVFQMLRWAGRYKNTFGSVKQFEIWYFICASCYILCFLPVVLFREINYLFYMFAVNSALRYWLIHTQQLRQAVALYRPVKDIRRLHCLFVAKYMLLILLCFTPILSFLRSDVFRLNCELPHLYPLQFCGIFILDLVSSIFDMLQFVL